MRPSSPPVPSARSGGVLALIAALGFFPLGILGKLSVQAGLLALPWRFGLPAQHCCFCLWAAS